MSASGGTLCVTSTTPRRPGADLKRPVWTKPRVLLTHGYGDTTRRSGGSMYQSVPAVQPPPRNAAAGAGKACFTLRSTHKVSRYRPSGGR